MNARPILFSSAMVRALLDGTKTQTRRIVKDADNGVTTCIEKNDEWPLHAVDKNGAWHPRQCPYGKPGDLLWVRETWAMNSRATDLAKIYYKAHENRSHTEFHELVSVEGLPKKYQPTWPRFKPSIHMPKAFSRITLEITGVRVERLQDISVADASAEGIFTPEIGYANLGERAPIIQYGALWESINGDGAWAINPWVWVVEFKVHKRNVDELLRERGAA